MHFSMTFCETRPTHHHEIQCLIFCARTVIQWSICQWSRSKSSVTTVAALPSILHEPAHMFCVRNSRTYFVDRDPEMIGVNRRSLPKKCEMKMMKSELWNPEFCLSPRICSRCRECSLRTLLWHRGFASSDLTPGDQCSHVKLEEKCVHISDLEEHQTCTV